MLTNLVAFLALVVAAVVAIINVRDRRNAKYQIANQYESQLLVFHQKAVDVLIELKFLSDHREESRKRALLIQLSSLIEQGRFYFPNIKSSQHGLDKPPAYRGFRNLALDFLVASYCLHQKPVNERTKIHAEQLQRLFTSLVFEIVNPSNRLHEIRKITDRYFIKDLSVEDLDNEEQMEAIDHMWDRPR